MKIVVVEFSPSGGLYQFALQLADAYAVAGHEVELVTGRRPELAPSAARLRPVLLTWHPAGDDPPWLRSGLGARLRVVRRAVRALRLVLAWVQVAVLLLRSRPDVVQWAEWRFALDGWWVRQIVRLLARSGRPPLHVDVAHTPVPFSEQRTTGELYRTDPRLLRSLGRAYAAMDLVLVLGASARRDLERTFDRLPRVAIISHGDEAVFRAVGTGAAAGDAAGSGADPSGPPSQQGPCVLFFGTLARYKGLDGLLEAFALVRGRRPDAKLLIAGAPADVDLPALERTAGRVGGVTLQVGYVPAADVAGLVLASRVVVAPYVLANQSGVVHLAATFGRPVVATDVGDLGDAVEDGRTGLLVPPGDVTALADALLRLLDDPELADELGDAAAQRSAGAASWATVAGEVLPVLDELRKARR